MFNRNTTGNRQGVEILKQQTTEDYLLNLESKGFKFQEDSISFIYFGKKYTNATDEIVNLAIEITLKVQKTFDSSFYMSILEALQANNIHTWNAALDYLKTKGIQY